VWHLFLFAEVDELAIEAVAGGAPAVLIEQAAAVVAPREVLLEELVELRDEGLHEAGERDGSSTRMGMSQTRNSMVSKNGWRRMSHQIFLALSMHLVLTRRSR